MRNQKTSSNLENKGFTLIEVLVVIAVIALLSSIALIALMSARQKSRDARRVADMTQMATGMQLYFNTNNGYPSSTNGDPSAAMIPAFLAHLPTAPLPADGGCDGVTYPFGGNGSQFYYYPSPTGGSYVLNGVTVFPDYVYYFCLGKQTGNLDPGLHQVTPRGLR